MFYEDILANSVHNFSYFHFLTSRVSTAYRKGRLHSAADKAHIAAAAVAVADDYGGQHVVFM